MKKAFQLLIVGVFCLSGFTASAQGTYEQIQEIVKAEVTAVLDEREEEVIGTDTMRTVQSIEALLLDGPNDGDTITFENDFIVVKEGDAVFLSYIRSINGDEFYVLRDVNRQGGLVMLTILFVALLLWFAGRQGARALLSLSLSIAAIIFVLIPALLAGYNPLWVSLGVAGVILAIVLFGTHGFNPRTYVAFFGTWGAVLCTSIIATVFVSSMRLTGFSSDASVSLNFATDGSLDFAGLLLGSIIIGILGVLDDVSITQASVVQELKHANNSLSVFELYQRAIRVGRDHVGSLVNTLALAYVGVSLPLVLLFATSEASLVTSLNQEIIAAEIVRIMIGSIGLILAVPLTTIAAAWYFGTHGIDETDFSSHGHHHH